MILYGSGENWRRNQANDRAYRIGQDKPVFVHKLICAGTVEDRINQLQ